MAARAPLVARGVCSGGARNLTTTKKEKKKKTKKKKKGENKRISTTTYVPDFARIARFSKCDFSH